MTLLGNGAAVWLETLVALVLLGLCGGWTLLPFGRPERPFLALASPLAGLATLGGSLDLLHRGLGLSIPGALGVGACANIGLTARWALARRPSSWTSWSSRVAALAAVAAWGALACNYATIRAGEPTVLTALGTDTYGYAMVADWLLNHAPGAALAYDTARPFEALPHVFWHLDKGRPASFLLVAAASWARGTSALFSCDWVFGVALAAAILGLGGALARDRRALALLLLAGASSAWLLTARTGYLGKTLCYPGCLLLAVVYVELTIEQSVARCWAGVALGLGVGGMLNPTVPTGLLASSCVGTVTALLLSSRGRPPWRAVAVAVGVWLLLCGPRWLVLLADGGSANVPGPLVGLTRALEASLDLDAIAVRYLDPALAGGLLAGALALTAGLSLVALPRRRAPALLACTALLPLAIVTGNCTIYAFHGVLYPFTVGGAVLLHEELRGRPRARRLVLVALALSILARLPHTSAFFRSVVLDHVFWRGPELPVRASEVQAIREAVGRRSADLVGSDPYFLSLLQTELALRGSDLRCCAASWRLVPLPLPVELPKAELSIVQPGQWAPPERVLHRSAHAIVVADRDAVTIRSILGDQRRDERGRLAHLVGAAPVRVELWNGTGAAVDATFALEARYLAADGQAAPRSLRLRFDGGERPTAVPAASTITVTLPLRLRPGFTWLEVDDPTVGRTDQAPLLLAELRLEPGP